MQQTIDDTVRGLGYESVETERSPGGLLRVTIDLPWSPSDAVVHSITVEDCERVTRQLQYVLEVEGADYKRLEVSSPGIDRPLRNELDFERFQGQVVDLVLKAPVGAAVAAGQVNANRKKFRGALQRAEPSGWQIMWSDEVVAKPGQRVSARRAAPPVHVMAFALDELQSVRLAPIVDFKGRGHSAPDASENVKD